MPSYTNVFGGNAVRAADQSLTKITMSTNTVLVWPSDGGSPATSAIIEVNATVPGLTLKLPDARNASNGESITFRCTGANAFNVINANNGSVLTVGVGLSYTVYLSDNSTLAGVWSFWQAGAGSSVTSADAIRGAGLDTLSGLLRVRAATSNYSTAQAFSDNDRGSCATWTGGSGTFSMPRANSVGNGWYMIFKNAGSGTLQIAATNAELFDGASDITLAPSEGATVFSNGTNFSFVRHGAGSGGDTFSYISVSIAGTGDYTLSALEYSRKAIRLTGTITGNRNVIVPTNVRDYWIDNTTSGAFTVTVKTAAGTGVVVSQGKRSILYCDGVNVVASDNDYPAGISIPVLVANGGTGATTAGAALTNLGGTTVGTQVFTAANAAAGRAAISAASTGTNTDISSIYLGNTGLKIRDTDATHGLSIIPSSNLTVDRTLSIATGDADRTLDISAGSVTVTAVGNAVTSAATAAAQRTALGLGSSAVLNENGGANTPNTVMVLNGSALIPNYDGRNLRNLGCVVQAPLIFTGSGAGTFTTGVRTNYLWVEVVGAGGGGGGVSSAANPGGGGGGGSGGYAGRLFTVNGGTTYNYTLGTPGAGGTNTGGNGGNGSDTTFTVGATTITGSGGLGGTGRTAATGVVAGGTGGSGSLGDFQFNGRRGEATLPSTALSGSGGQAPLFGMGGPYAVGSSNGSAGQFGAGGSGASTASAAGFTGGTGGVGLITITEMM